jgi:hypothetical protein
VGLLYNLSMPTALGTIQALRSALANGLTQPSRLVEEALGRAN